MKLLKDIIEQALNETFAPYFWQKKIQVSIEINQGVYITIEAGSDSQNYYFTDRYLDNPRILCEECIKTYCLHRTKGILDRIPLMVDVKI